MSMKPPQHPIEVRITIGGEDWQYVRRIISELHTEANWREPEHFQMYGGGAGGSYSVTTTQRDIKPEDFRRELEEWAKSENGRQ